jgi:hypothetical protein
MTDEPKKEPRSRFRTMLEGEDEKKESEKKSSPLTRLPRKADAATFSAEEANATPAPTPKPTKNLDQPPPEPDPASKGSRLNFGPPFWTITGAISLLVNAVLIAILLGLLMNMGKLDLAKINQLSGLPNDLVSGLYTNFEKMDRATIATNVKVDTNIPVKFDLQINQQTTVVLSQAVTIPDARVTVRAGEITITDALTSIVLPAGTNLPIVLNLTVPVDKSVPVTLDVPVNIKLHDTELGIPFQGLQDVIEPLYCLLEPEATNLDGQPICPNPQ